MADNAQLNQIVRLIDDASKHSARADKSWESIASSVDSITRQFESGWPAAFAKSGGLQRQALSFGNIIKSSLMGEKAGILKLLEGMEEKLVSLEAQRRILESDPALKTPTGRMSKAGKARIEEATADIKLQNAKITCLNVISNLEKHEAFTYLPAMLNGLGKAQKFHEAINISLIESNSSWGQRLSMMEKINAVQIRTGIATDDMAEATKSLLKYGHDLTDNFAEALALTTMMKVGLGVSADTTSQMLATTKSIGGNWKEVADGIARVKEDTALAADQAARFAIEIGNAMALLGPKAGTQLGAIGEYINRLEGSAQKLGVQAGGIKDVLVGFTTEKGMMGATALGLDPTFLTDLERTRMATERFSSFVNQQLSGTTGWQRMVMLQQLAEYFGTSIEVIGRLNEIVADQNKQRKSQITVESAFANQTKTLTDQWNRLKASLGAIINAVLIPVIATANAVIWPFTKLLGVIGKSEKALWALSAAMTAVMVIQMAKMIAALRTMAIGDIILGSLGKGVIGKGISGFLARFLGGGGAATAAKGVATAATRATGWQMIVRLLPQIGRGLLTLGGTVSAAFLGTALAIGAVVTGAVVLGTNLYYKRLDALNRKNQNDYVKAILSGSGKSMDVWRAETSKFIEAHPQMSEKDISRYLHKTTSDLAVVQQALMKGDKAAAKRIVEGVFNEFINTGATARYRRSMSENVTINREQDMARDRIFLDTLKRSATNQGLVVTTLEDTSRKQLIELEKSRIRDDEWREWRENHEMLLRSTISNSSSASTGLNMDAGVHRTDH